MKNGDIYAKLGTFTRGTEVVIETKDGRTIRNADIETRWALPLNDGSHLPLNEVAISQKERDSLKHLCVGMVVIRET